MVLKFRKRSRSGQEGGTAGKKSFKASKGEKFVLFVGDEGAILIHLKGASVLSRQFVPDNSTQSLGELRQALMKSPDAPLAMIVDSIDQTYVQQTLPPVSRMSVGKLIKRRLDRDFGVNDIKGAILLGRESTGRKDWNFMMVSLERNPQFTIWIDFVTEVPNYFLGIYLVSAETQMIVGALESSLGVAGKKDENAARWKFFVSHNKVGGFRQVILRDGRIVFTRLAQPIGESTNEVIAGNIEQEMLSTIEYMRRLSYDAQAGLDIYIIASSGIREAIDATKFSSNSFTVLTPYEMAEHFGIEGATQPTDQFGDVILAAIIGSSRKHILTLNTPELKRFEMYYYMLYMQRFGVALTTLALIFYSGLLAFEMFTLSTASDDLIQHKTAQQRNLDEIKADISKSNLDLAKANDLLDLYLQIMSEKATPLPFITRLKPVVEPPVFISAVEWSLGDTRPEATASPPVTSLPASEHAPAKPPKVTADKMTAVVTLEFPAVANDAKSYRVLSKKMMADFMNGFVNPYSVNYNYTNLQKAMTTENQAIQEFEKEQAEMEAPQVNSSNSPEMQLIIKGFVETEESEPPSAKPPS